MEAQAARLRCYTTLKAVLPEVNIMWQIAYISEDDAPDEWAKKIRRVGWDWKDCLDVTDE